MAGNITVSSSKVITENLDSNVRSYFIAELNSIADAFLDAEYFDSVIGDFNFFNTH